jgi:hypothetical protein
MRCSCLYPRELTWLSAKDNKIDGLNSIQKLLKMQILNIGNNREKSLLPAFQPISHREWYFAHAPMLLLYARVRKAS